MASKRPRFFLSCPRCESPLEYAGTKRLDDGSRPWDPLGGAFELLRHREAIDTYVCPRCGRVEQFVAGIGEDLRTDAESDYVMYEPPPAEPAADGEWRCPRCGTVVPGTAAICPQCSLQRTATASGGNAGRGSC